MTAARLISALESLGSTPEAIRRSLAAYPGLRVSGRENPVALYLRRNGFPDPVVAWHGVSAPLFLGDQWTQCTGSEALRGFLLNFDRGWYPELDRPLVEYVEERLREVAR